MAKTRETFTCSACDHEAHKWFGRCPECGEWSTAVATSGVPGSGTAKPRNGLVVSSLSDAEEISQRWTVGISEVDRVLGGGLVPGGVVLLAGEPGIGKSTLVLQLLDSMGRSGRRCLMVTGEESLQQVSMRGKRLGIEPHGFSAAAGTSLPDIVHACALHPYDVVIVDSIQTLSDPDLGSAAGTPTQVRDCASALIALAKTSGTALILVGHVTKDGNVAGPKTLEHMVDAVVTLEGDRSGALRLLRAAKNRFGSCEETGVFVMEQHGLEAVDDPSSMLLADRRLGVPGSILYPGIEGTRPLMSEIQALVTPAPDPTTAKRICTGIDQRRMAMLLGVLAERVGIRLGSCDVFVAAAGGIAVKEPAVDLAVALALASAHSKTPCPSGVVAFGEVGLGGEVRRVPSMQRRLTEAARMGATTALVPAGLRDKQHGSLEVIEVGDLSHALAIMEHDTKPSKARSARARAHDGRVTLDERPVPLLGTR
jgi:DNA repair protein RadA/Sms